MIGEYEEIKGYREDARYEIRLAGMGGQGLLLAGLILGEALALYDGKNVVQAQSYGAEARGGASRSEVIIAEEGVDYPRVIRADLCLALSQEACDRYGEELKTNGILIVDSQLVDRLPEEREAYQFPITQWAELATGRRITANIFSLGLIAGLTDIVTRPSLEKSLRAHVPKGTEELNMKALAAGFDRAAEIKAGSAAATHIEPEGVCIDENLMP